MATAVTNSSAKAGAAERSAQVVTTTANLMRLLRESSQSEIIAQLPKDLAAKVPNIRSTGKLLEQMPAVIVALDTHLDEALKSASHLKKVNILLAPHEVSNSKQDLNSRQQQESSSKRHTKLCSIEGELEMG